LLFVCVKSLDQAQDGIFKVGKESAIFLWSFLLFLGLCILKCLHIHWCSWQNFDGQRLPIFSSEQMPLFFPAQHINDFVVLLDNMVIDNQTIFINVNSIVLALTFLHPFNHLRGQPDQVFIFFRIL
jgi:hypothetical protein